MLFFVCIYPAGRPYFQEAREARSRSVGEQGQLYFYSFDNVLTRQMLEWPDQITVPWNLRACWMRKRTADVLKLVCLVKLPCLLHLAKHVWGVACLDSCCLRQKWQEDLFFRRTLHL